MRYIFYIALAGMLLLSSCSVKRNNFFSRNYHQMVTRYNVYFNGKEALKSGQKNMDQKHREDYTNLLPVFVSNNDQTRMMCSADMDYAIEKAAKAIDKHSITVKPRRRKNKDSRSYQTFRKKKEFNKQMVKCYLLLGKAYFYKKKYPMANNTFRFIQRQYAEDEKTMTEVNLWLFRSLTEMGRYDEAAKFMNQLSGADLDRSQREMLDAARTDFYVRQGLYAQAIPPAEQLVKECRNMKRKPRYNFMLSQLYLKNNQDGQAMNALKKSVRFNFDYEMVFNARINMALAWQEGDDRVRKELSKMLRDVKNDDFRDRIYYALGNIEEKKGNEKEAIDLYWKSVRSTVDNDNQQALSFYKLGAYYFKERDYITAQSCYDSCMLLMDSRYEDYEKIRTVLTDLTDLVGNLRTIQQQDSLLKLAAMPESERTSLIDDKINEIREKEIRAKEEEQKAQTERNFYDRNNMLSRGDATANTGGNDWYFYNPMTVSLGKNDFKRKWGRRKLEDNWRRQNKAMVEFSGQDEKLAQEGGDKEEKKDVKSRDYYLKDIPFTDEAKKASEKQLEDAYGRAGELYMYKFDDPARAVECFEAFMQRFPSSQNLPMIYYFAYSAADKMGDHAKAEKFRSELISKFPDSDFARGLQDPNYFKKVDSELKVIERMYEEAYAKYQQVYYGDALRDCEEILRKYPDNKLRANVLFLRAMCVMNLYSVQEARVALEQVMAAKPDKEIQGVVTSLLSSLSVGEKPVLYTDADMAEARSLKASRVWVFDEKGEPVGESEKEKMYTVQKDKECVVLMILPEDMNLAQTTKLKARLMFINAGEAVEGKNYEMNTDDLWYKRPGLTISKFENYAEAGEYLSKVANDKQLLKIIGTRNYRMFAITSDNLAIMKRQKNVEDYVDFFAGNYFEDQKQGEILVGKHGTVAHIFTYEESEKHNFALVLPFRKINTKRIAEVLHGIEPAFMLSKEDYDGELEMIIVKNVGNKAQALEYLNTVMKNKELFDRMAGVDYEAFVITENNQKVLVDNGYLDEYLTFFADNYIRDILSVGVEDGEFVYNKDVPHKFILFYSNKIDPFKLKEEFEAFNFAGLTMNNMKYDGEHDCLVVSGFNKKEDAMRYFMTVMSNRKLFKPLRNTDYTNFIITIPNLEVMKEKQALEKYLEFFKKYYLNN